MKYSDRDVFRLDGNLVNNTCNALRVAAERFDEDAKVCGASIPGSGGEQLVEQFKRQAREARVVAALFEALETCDGNVCIATFCAHSIVRDILKGES